MQLLLTHAWTRKDYKGRKITSYTPQLYFTEWIRPTNIDGNLLLAISSFIAPSHASSLPCWQLYSTAAWMSEAGFNCQGRKPQWHEKPAQFTHLKQKPKWKSLSWHRAAPAEHPQKWINRRLHDFRMKSSYSSSLSCFPAIKGKFISSMYAPWPNR